MTRFAVRFSTTLSAIVVAGLMAGCGDTDVTTCPGCDGSGGVVSNGDHCVVRATYLGSKPFDWAMFEIDYSRVLGGFGAPSPATGACHTVTKKTDPFIIANTCEHDCSQGEKRYLHVELYTAERFDSNDLAGPAEVLRCDFHGDSSTLGRLTVDSQLEDRTGSWIGDGRIELTTDCSHATTTTSTSTTSTTECSGGACADDDAAMVEVQLHDDRPLGAFQMQATFPCSAGHFEHVEGWDVIRCERGDLALSLWAANEHTLEDASGCRREVNIGMISLTGIAGPGTALRCPFHAANPGIDADSFESQLLDATDTDGNPYANVNWSFDVVR